LRQQCDWSEDRNVVLKVICGKMLVSYYCPVTVLASAALTIAISTDVVIGCCLS